MVFIAYKHYKNKSYLSCLHISPLYHSSGVSDQMLQNTKMTRMGDDNVKNVSDSNQTYDKYLAAL